MEDDEENSSPDLSQTKFKKCDLCSKEFKSDSKLSRHLKRKHFPKLEEGDDGIDNEEVDVLGELEENDDDDRKWSSHLEQTPSDMEKLVESCIMDKFFKDGFIKEEIDPTNCNPNPIEVKNDLEYEETFKTDANEWGYDADGEMEQEPPLFKLKEVKCEPVADKDLEDLNERICEEILFAAPFFLHDINYRYLKEKTKDPDPVEEVDENGDRRPKRKYAHKEPRLKEDSECLFCGKKFKSKALFAYHMNIHTHEKPYFCEYCDESFATPNYLTKHVRKHVDPMRFFCPICGKGFTEVYNLKHHMRHHSKVKPYQCEECGKRYTQPGYLRVHIRTKHGSTEEIKKRFKCKKCDKHFTVKQTLKLHKKHAHVPTKCPICEEEFESGKLMRMHKKLMHLSKQPKKKKAAQTPEFVT